MSRRSRKNLENNTGMNSMVYISIGIAIIAVATFIIAYVLYGNRLNKQSKITNTQKISSSQGGSMLNIIENSKASTTSSTMGKSVNEMQNEQSTNAVDKRAVNTSATEKATVAKKKESTKTNSTNTQKTNNTEVQSKQSVDPTFIKPVDGDVIKDYATDTLVYSNTLEEWTTHLGIDYAAEKTSIVKASAEGTVKSIKNDPRYGLTLVLEHSNGFTSLYANLLSTEFVTVGEKVTQGQTIATVGNTATFEIADETHLHFEILKDGVNVDPNLYIK